LNRFVDYYTEFSFADHVHIVYDDYWKLAVRDGETYINMERATATATPTNVHIHITNLFSGNKLLGKIQNTSTL
jgi:hypothetical protein